MTDLDDEPLPDDAIRAVKAHICESAARLGRVAVSDAKCEHGIWLVKTPAGWRPYSAVVDEVSA